jgi:hypothetical protein
MAVASDGTFSNFNTDHGLLVAFGEFLQQHGLLKQLMQVPISQKTGTFTPQAKLIEFLAGIFSGIEYLADLNDAPHPLAHDEQVARAWGLAGWAHYSNVSRTLSACDADTVAAVRQAIEAFHQPFIRTAVDELARRGQPIVYDLDLMGQPVSSKSTSYRGVGWMDDALQLGYQLARVCLTTVTGERLWLNGFHHPGDTVSCACLQELVHAAEAQTGVRPRRRTPLVQQRITATEQLMERPRRLLAQQETQRTHLRETELGMRVNIAQAEAALKKGTKTACSERRRKRLQAWQTRLPRLAQQLSDCERAIAHHQTYLQELTVRVTELKTWLAQLEADNCTNPDPPVCEVRMDSGFSGGEPVAWLIEMGYQVNTKAPSDKTTQVLRKQVSPKTTWTRVGANAEMTEPIAYSLKDCPYPLRVSLERFKVGKSYRYATLLQFRDVGTPPPVDKWFQSYNGRQTIEAGNKESKSGVFHVQHVMTRSLYGIQLQVLFTGLAANAVRWAMPWLNTCTKTTTIKFEQTLDSPKHLVRVAANASALVHQSDQGTALQFASNSALPGVTLFLKGVPAFQLPLGFQMPVQNHN